MQVATTLQFRNVVRKYAKVKGLTIHDSYTNGAPMHGSKLSRTVGFCMPSATPEIATEIEVELNQEGLTAKTRCTGEGYAKSPSRFAGTGSHTYIRGTCTIK